MSDLISRRAAIEAVEHITSSMSVCVNTDECHGMKRMQRQAVIELANLPSAQPEPLTDKEQRIFLAAMGREEKVCEEVDRNYVREPYEDSLVRVCKEIRRKVKGALWI